MLNKIYLIVLAIFVLVISVLIYLAYDWLGSVTTPVDVVTNYELYIGYGRKFLWLSTLILLILANVILWKERKSWAFWATSLYFAVFVLLQTFWLDRSFVQFQNSKGLANTTLSIGPIVGVSLVIAVGFFVYFNQFLVKRMADKMFSKTDDIQELPGTIDEKPSEN